MQSDFSFGTILLIIGIAVVVFLLLREFWCWFYKINQIRDLLLEIARNRRHTNPLSAEALPQSMRTWKCPKCSSENLNNTFKCNNCRHDLLT